MWTFDCNIKVLWIKLKTYAAFAIMTHAMELAFGVGSATFVSIYVVQPASLVLSQVAL